MSEITLMRDSAESGAAPDLLGGLRAVGIGEGDIVFVQLSPEASALGGADANPGQAAHAVLEQLRRAVGAGGTLVVPTYTFSFCRGEPFDPDSTPAVAGPWQPWVEFAEVFRRQPGTLRSRDPIHSVAAAGPEAAALVHNVAPTCFGPGSLFERLKLLGAKLCLIGLPLEEATFRHHTEEMAEVPFRYKKLF
ncbi:MAG TPA: AAC(3) family N-acetyltransferase, partial [Gemmatimonadales bacterium]|nr:AAC(3) family N-acetyltransferase [Gemmatimonadales bacterium]